MRVCLIGGEIEGGNLEEKGEKLRKIKPKWKKRK
jgi:hypothetical protein